GHGVGMSQWGAYGMSVQGVKYQDILEYYYKGIKIIKEY
ncbi:MAG: sporulation protein, partial [Candidatus Atribacteria bacterium]|nr:sporulation protein [Candidatus Atribacteria bacterium]